VIALAPVILMGHNFLDTYHICDARRMLSILPESEFVDTTITSPPYWNLKDYKSKRQVGYGQNYGEYLDDLEKIFSSVYTITKRSGSLWVVADTIKHGGELELFPFDLADRLKRCGWILHDIIVWLKDKTLPWSHKGKLRNIFEYILFFSKTKQFKYYLSEVRETNGIKQWWVRYPERYSPLGRAPSRTWKFSIPRQGSWGDNWVRHFCPFPPELVRRITLLTTKRGDVILDPFAGSGVVLAEARALGRHYVGFDLRESYRRMFAKRVLPTITKLGKANAKLSQAEQKKRKDFSARIWKLRKLKYPREMIKLYEKRYGRMGVVGALAFSHRKHFLEVIFIFSPGKRPAKEFSKRIAELMRRPPLSKFGLQVAVESRMLTSNGKITPRNGFVSGQMLSVYERGKTYHASQHLSQDNYLRLVGDNLHAKPNGVPPIASNMYACIEPSKAF